MACKQPSTVRLTCYNHENSDVVAICVTHNDLLCVTCLMEMKHSKDCERKQIDECQDEKWKQLVDHVAARQKTLHLKDVLMKTKSDMSSKEETLFQEVEDLYKELSRILNQKTTQIKDLIKQKADVINDDVNRHIKILDDCEKDLETNLKTIKDEDTDILKCLASITSHLDAIEGKDKSEVDGSFNPSKCIEDFRKDETVLGTVDISYANIYEDMNNDQTAKVTPEDQRPLEAGSDGVIYPNTAHNVGPVNGSSRPSKNPATQLASPSLADTADDGATEHTETQAREPVQTGPCQIQNETKPEIPPRRATKDKRPLGIGVSKKQPVSKNEAQPTPSGSGQQLKEYEMKRIQIPGIEGSSSKFSQLIHLSDNVVALLCPGQSSVLVTTLLNGPTTTKKFPGNVAGIVATGPKTLAVLVSEKKGKHVYSVKLKHDKLDGSGKFSVPNYIAAISGFGFSVLTSQYIISSPSMRIILDKKGKLFHTSKFPETSDTDATNIQSVYDFETEQIVYLNVVKKTYKSFSCQTDVGELLWRKRIDDREFVPRSLYLHSGVIYVASASSVVTFAAKDGSPTRTIETDKVLPDCSAVCVDDDVLMWTSKSEDPGLSTSIGFLAI